MKTSIVTKIPLFSEKDQLEELFNQSTEYITYSFDIERWPSYNNVVFITETEKKEFDELEEILRTNIDIVRAKEIINKYNIILYDNTETSYNFLQELIEPREAMSLNDIFKFWKQQTQLFGPLDYFEYKFYETDDISTMQTINETIMGEQYKNRSDHFGYIDFIVDRGIKINESHWIPILRNDRRIVYRRKCEEEECNDIENYKKEFMFMNELYLEDIENEELKNKLDKAYNLYQNTIKEVTSNILLLYDPISFHIAYRNTEYLDIVHNEIKRTKVHVYAYGFNLLLREELIVKSNATKNHRFVLTAEEMRNLYKYLSRLIPSERIRQTFPYSTASRANLYYENKIDAQPTFDAENAYNYVQKQYNAILSYFPRNPDIIASVHGSNLLYAVLDKTIEDNINRDLDIRICGKDGNLLTEEKFNEYIENLKVSLQKYTDYQLYVIEHSKTKHTFHFPHFKMDVYNSFWGIFNTYHVPMVRGDLQFIPNRKLYGTFTFFYSMLTNIALDIRYTPTETSSLLGVIQKYGSRGFPIYCTNKIIEEIYNNEKNRDEFIGCLNTYGVIFSHMGINRFDISNIYRFVNNNIVTIKDKDFEMSDYIKITDEINMNRDHVIVYVSDNLPMSITGKRIENIIYYLRDKYYTVYYKNEQYLYFNEEDFRVINLREVVYSEQTYPITNYDSNSPVELFCLKYDSNKREYEYIGNYVDFLAYMKLWK